MDWYAFEEIDEALEETKELLLPFDPGIWARLLLLALFTAGGLNMPTGSSWNPSSYAGGDQSGDYTSTDFSSNGEIQNALSEPLSQPMTSLATGTGATSAIVGVLALLFIGFMLMLFYISSVLELIYYQSLLDRDVNIRSNFRKHARRGFSYFGFRLTVMLLGLIILGVPIALIFASPLLGLPLLGLALLLLVSLLVFLGLTNNFVLPRMIENGENVLPAWKAIYPDLKREWHQATLYVFVRLGVKIVAGLLGMLWALATLVGAVIIFGVSAVVMYLVHPWLAVAPVVFGLLVWLTATLSAQVPIQTYLHYYAILVYHDLTA